MATSEPLSFGSFYAIDRLSFGELTQWMDLHSASFEARVRPFRFPQREPLFPWTPGTADWRDPALASNFICNREFTRWGDAVMVWQPCCSLRLANSKVQMKVFALEKAVALPARSHS